MKTPVGRLGPWADGWVNIAPQPEDPLDALRADFERLCPCPAGHKRSRRGTYVNPPTANRWKWFQLGAIAARNIDP